LNASSVFSGKYAVYDRPFSYGKAEWMSFIDDGRGNVLCHLFNHPRCQTHHPSQVDTLYQKCNEPNTKHLNHSVNSRVEGMRYHCRFHFGLTLVGIVGVCNV
jgi:hypothetical protein